MKAIIFLVSTVVVFVVGNGLIAHKQYVLNSGQTMLLQLAPVDPRSLMQGDYMILRYGIARESRRAFAGGASTGGHLVVKLDANQVVQFVRVHAEEPLADGEYLLRYRRRGQIRLGAESFFFQEGHAQYYENARYGELKVALSGNSVLVGLRDANFNQLGPQAESADLQ